MVEGRLPWALVAALAVMAPIPGAAQILEGRVVDLGTAEPVAAALVELISADEATAEAEPLASLVADQEGRFLLRAPATGTYRLRAGRIGYETAVTPSFDLVRDEEPLEVEVLLAVEAVALAPLVIVSERPARMDNLRLHIRGYYDRKRAWGREGLGFGRCVPTVFVDGVPAATGADVDGMVSMAEVSAVEIYWGSTIPAEFWRSLSGGCPGAVVIWTGPTGG